MFRRETEIVMWSYKIDLKNWFCLKKYSILLQNYIFTKKYCKKY